MLDCDELVVEVDIELLDEVVTMDEFVVVVCVVELLLVDVTEVELVRVEFVIVVVVVLEVVVVIGRTVN
jgi:hypothetical protein